jgi:hypothetical protein
VTLLHVRIWARTIVLVLGDVTSESGDIVLLLRRSRLSLHPLGVLGAGTIADLAILCQLLPGILGSGIFGFFGHDKAPWLIVTAGPHAAR